MRLLSAEITGNAAGALENPGNPQGSALAALTGLPPQYGLDTAIVPSIVAASFGSSLHMVSGPPNAHSLALAATLAPLVVVGSANHIELALTVTVIVGVMQLLIGGLRQGALANFISPAALRGFMSGAAVRRMPGLAASQGRHWARNDTGDAPAQVRRCAGCSRSARNHNRYGRLCNKAHCQQPAHGENRRGLTEAIDLIPRGHHLNAGAAAVAMLLLAAGCATPPAPAPESPIDSLPPLAAASAVQAPAAAAASTSAPERVAERLVEPPAPPLPRIRLDPLQDAARAQLWQRLREGFVLPDLDTDLVLKWEQWYARDPDYVQRMTERSGRYLFHVVEEVERRGLPTELALLPFIESAFNPQALSRAAAAGMWQFMPDTGKDFELYQNVFRDDRRDVLASTRAALDYLQQLHGMFGNWPLALAAYNWGQGNVTRAIALNKRAGLATDYLSLSPRMPQETREYVPKLQAVKNIVARPEDFGLSLPALSDQPYFLSVPIERDIDVALVARLSGMSLEDFRQLNPQLKKPLILAAGTPQVLLPYDNANRFITNRALHQGPLASWTAWVAPRNLSAAQAARRLGISEVELRELNHIPPRMLIKGGSTLVVPRTGSPDDVAEHIADHGTLALAPDLPPLRRVLLKIGRKGGSVAAVARRYRVDAGQLAQWNGIGVGGRFKAGQRIVLMLPAAKGQPARAGAKLVKSPSGKAIAAKVKGRNTVPRKTKATPPAKPRAARKRQR